MKATELRIGNYIKDERDGIGIVELYHLDFAIKDNHTFNCVFYPIPLSEQWLKDFNIKERTVIGETKQRMFIDNIEIPEWIKYVHDLQNWYYYKFEKKELIKK